MTSAADMKEYRCVREPGKRVFHVLRWKWGDCTAVARCGRSFDESAATSTRYTTAKMCAACRRTL